MPTFKIILAYDGTDFVGWQRQASGTSIQSLVEDALQDLDGQPVTVCGAGRTDAGVHALGQVAGFSLEKPIGPDSLARALNVRLPETVRVLEASNVPGSFHARFSARSKRYRYRIWNADVMSPFERRYAWHVGEPIEIERMAAAAKLLDGSHDFAAFQAAKSATRTTERIVFSSRVDAHGRLITYDIHGSGFLRHMVRTIAGTLVDIGRGHRPVEWIEEVLASRDRSQAGPTAPAEGLFLVDVEYAEALAAGP